MENHIFKVPTLDCLDEARQVIQSNGRAKVVYVAFFPTSNSCGRCPPNFDGPEGYCRAARAACNIE